MDPRTTQSVDRAIMKFHIFSGSGAWIPAPGIESNRDLKVGCVFLMVVVSMLPLTEIGRNDHREDASHFNKA